MWALWRSALPREQVREGRYVTPYLARVSATLRINSARRRPGARIRRRWHSVPLPHRPGEHPPGALPSHPRCGAFSQEESPQARRILKNLAALPHMAAARRDGAHARMAQENAPDLSERLFYTDRYVYLTVYQAFTAEGRYTEARMLMAALSEYLMACDRVIDTIHYDVFDGNHALAQRPGGVGAVDDARPGAGKLLRVRTDDHAVRRRSAAASAGALGVRGHGQGREGAARAAGKGRPDGGVTLSDWKPRAVSPTLSPRPSCRCCASSARTRAVPRLAKLSASSCPR